MEISICVDLRTLAGNRYRLSRDEAYAAECGERAQTVDLWLLQIPARFGHFYPHSDTLVGFATHGRGSTAHRLAMLPGVQVVQDADDGYNLAFPRELFPMVASIARPKRRRKLSPEHKAKLLAATKPFKRVQVPVSKAPKTAQIRLPAA